MKLKHILFTIIFFFAVVFLQAQNQTENIVIILIDGCRWQEVFKGADSELLTNKKYVNKNDSLQLMEKYWSEDINERRQKLMPFVWNYIAKHGQIYGNRDIGNKVNVKNPYWGSYPGRAEIFSGFVDTLINSNSYLGAPKTNFLEFINNQKSYKDKVAAFACGPSIPKCLRKNESNMFISSPGEYIPRDNLTELEILANEIQRLEAHPWGDIGQRLDNTVYALSKSYILTQYPKVIYMEVAELDSYAHEGKYKSYLDNISNFDAMIELLWNKLQKEIFYKNKTTFFIITDHGRGVGAQWINHTRIPRADETWFMVIGPDTKPLGEMKTTEQIYHTQYAATIAKLLRFDYQYPGETVGEVIESVMSK